MYVVINRCFGGFELSLKGLYTYCQKKHGQAFVYRQESKGVIERITLDEVADSRKTYYIISEDYGPFSSIKDVSNDHIIRWSSIPRNDLALVATIRELGDEANTSVSELKIVEIPNDVEDNFYIDEYDGMETIHENHRSWH